MLMPSPLTSSRRRAHATVARGRRARSRAGLVAVAGFLASATAAPANIIDGADDRGSLTTLGPQLGLSSSEIARIRKTTGYVGCLSPSPSMGAGALFVDNRQVLTAAHILFEPNGRRRSKCFFKSQDHAPVLLDLVLDAANARFGAAKPKAGSEGDYAIARLAAPVAGAEPFPVVASPAVAGERLIVVTAHPAGMARAVDKAVPVVQGCTVRRVLAATFRTDCDATGSSSGGLNLARVDGRLVVRGITVATGPWRNPKLEGAPYSEKRGSLTVALFAGGAVAAAGRSLAAAPWAPPAPGSVESIADAVRSGPAPAPAPLTARGVPDGGGAAPTAARPDAGARRPAPAATGRPADGLGLGLDTTFAPLGPARHDPLAP